MDCSTLGAFPEDSCDRRPFVVPVAAVRLLAESIDKLPDAEPVTLAGSQNEFCCESSAFSIRGKISEGRFPRYRDVIPRSGFNVVATFDRKPLIQSIESAAVVCDAESRGMDFKFTNGRLGLSAESAAFGKSDVSIAAATVREWNQTHTITFDPDYVLDVLKNSNADRITFDIVDGDTAAIMHDADDSDGLCVIMPLCQQP